jgi:hypothetical protein
MDRRTILAASAATTLVAAAGATTASAYTVTGGPALAGTASATTIGAVTCASSTVSATLNTGTGIGANLGSISALHAPSCVLGPITLGVTASNPVTVPPTPLPTIQATGPTVGGVTPVNLSSLRLRLVGALCSATVSGDAPGNYNNATRRLTVTTGGTLTFSNISGCFGLLVNGGAAPITATYNVVGSPSNPIAVNN